MADAGFYRGTSADQDSRFADKQRKLLQQMKFDDVLKEKVNVAKLNMDVIKPWITKRVNEILGIEDDVVIEFVFSQLEEKAVDPRVMQINLTGFLNAKRSREFVAELWGHLVAAQAEPDGIPPALIEMKMAQMQKKKEDEAVVRRATDLAESSRRPPSPPARARPPPDDDRERRDRDRRERERERERHERDRERERQRERDREAIEMAARRDREQKEQQSKAKDKHRDRQRSRSPERRRYTSDKRTSDAQRTSPQERPRRKFTETPAAKKDSSANGKVDGVGKNDRGEPMGPALPPSAAAANSRRVGDAPRSATKKVGGARVESSSSDEAAVSAERRQKATAKRTAAAAGKRAKRPRSSSSSSSGSSSASGSGSASSATSPSPEKPKKSSKESGKEAKLRERALQSLKRKGKGDR